MRRTSLALFTAFAVCPAIAATLPARAQETGGIAMRNPSAILGDIAANRGCQMSTTSVTVGTNQAMAAGASARQQLATAGGGASACRPLVSTQVVAGVNLSLGRGAAASQSIAAQGPRGLLATTAYTRGYNLGYGAQSSASQRLVNQIDR